jgi:hypothetical protein
MIDALHEQLYRALITHAGHTHGVYHPQNCPPCEAIAAFELRKTAELALAQEMKEKK